MLAQVLATKLFIPPSRPNLVSRPNLTERLNAGLIGGSKLTLISAPAGFGKTTLISEWITRSKRPAVWLSLDEGDNDPVRFLSYLVAALQTIKSELGEGLLAALHSTQPPSTDLLLTNLLNEITTIPDCFILALDDYHTIDSETIDHAIRYLLDHLPPSLHIVIATREDPHLPLASLRARGQLTELRATDLRFTPDEASEFLNRMMGLKLSVEDITALDARTEGWIAGLQLAAISMQGRADTSSFIRAFTGSHRFVLDYLVEEVLKRQPETIRSFLLQTSILERFCGPLCNAVTALENGREMLSALEEGNLFLVPLDDQRQWYRYHHLFAEVLQSYLRQEPIEQVTMLHRRASIWFERNDLISEAIPHALAARDFLHAADLIERIRLSMDQRYQHDTWLGWVRSLPEDLIRSRPVICLGYAWALLGTGDLEASEARLQDAEHWLASMDNTADNSLSQMTVVDEEEFRSLPAAISAARSYRALALGDIPGTMKHARHTIALSTNENTPQYTQATAMLALAKYASGDLREAEQDLLRFQSLMWQVNDLASAIGITFALANIKKVQGHLREAVSEYQNSLHLADTHGSSFFIGVADLHRGLGELLCEINDIEGAEKCLSTAQQMAKQGATTGWPQRFFVAQSRLKASKGDLPGALECLDEAERQYVKNPLPDPPIAALKARLHIRQGRLNEALMWARQQNLSPEDDLSFMREFDHLTLARALLSLYKTNRLDDEVHATEMLLERLLHAAEDGKRNGSVLEILILQSLTYQAQGDQLHSFASLERALSLAEPEGYVQIFLDEGAEMIRLIGDYRSHIVRIGYSQTHPLLVYVDKLLASYPQPVTGRPLSKAIIQNSQIIDPLSERELEVLRLLRSELSGPEIAQQLIVSLHTLRSHTNNIFKKLGVNNRRAAVRRAEDLNLL